jgi:hypothetical protein
MQRKKNLSLAELAVKIQKSIHKNLFHSLPAANIRVKINAVTTASKSHSDYPPLTKKAGDAGHSGLSKLWMS